MNAATSWLMPRNLLLFLHKDTIQDVMGIWVTASSTCGKQDDVNRHMS